MFLKRSVWVCSTFVVGVAWLLHGYVLSDDYKPSVVRRQFEGLQVEYFNNSPTLSQAVAISAAGSIIGSKEKLGVMTSQVTFYCGQNGCQDMPVPEGFTHVEATAISDTEIVVGRAMKAIQNQGSLRALVWTPAKSEIKLLPLPEGDGVGDASDITSNGKRIAGYATGPKGLRPVIWDWDEKESVWKVEVLPTVHENNPYLMASQLIMTPDGQTIVGCCTEQVRPDGTLDSALYEWRKVDNQWTRRLVTQEQMYVKAINSKGQIAGSVPGSQGRLPCLVTLDGTVKLLDLLEGDVAGEARDINEDSVIVGWSDDPMGPDGAPVPCTWNAEGKAAQLQLSENGVGMLFAINAKGQIAGTADFVAKPAAKDASSPDDSSMLAVRISRDK